MRKIPAIAVLAALVLAGCAGEAGVRKNLLENGSFEYADVDGQMPYWWGSWVPERNREFRRTELDRNVAFEGRHAVRIYPTGPALVLLFSKHYAVTPGETYTISFYAKGTAGEKDWVGVQYEFIDSEFNVVSKTGTRDNPITPEWSRIATTFAVPEGISYIRLFPQTYGHVDAWIDAVQMEEGDAATEFEPCPSPDYIAANSKPLVFSAADRLADERIAAVGFREQSFADYAYSAKRAFDGDTNTYWASNYPEKTCPKDLIVYFHAPQKIRAVIVSYYNDEQSPTDDGVRIGRPSIFGWRELRANVERQNVEIPGGNGSAYPVCTYTFGETVTTDEIRFRYTAVRAGADAVHHRPAIREMKFVYAE